MPVNPGYAVGQLTKALQATALSNDPKTTAAAMERAEKWQEVLDGMQSGSLVIGSRKPVERYPTWVTLNVLAGGFASGRALAATPVEADETALASRLGVEPARGRLFAYHLSDEGLDQLRDQLCEGNYRVEVPEHAALPIVAWFLGMGHYQSAMEVLTHIRPFADSLRFTPRPAQASIAAKVPPGYVSRLTVEQAREALRSRRPRPGVEDQRESLLVWNPLNDRAVALWHRLLQGDRIDLAAADDAWKEAAARLVQEHADLCTKHTRVSPTGRKRSTLRLLVDAAASLLTSGTVPHRQAGLVRITVQGTVKKRGAPGSDSLAALRAHQKRIGERPGAHTLGSIVAKRLKELNPHEGILRTGDYTFDVTEAEARPAFTASDLSASSPDSARPQAAAFERYFAYGAGGRLLSRDKVTLVPAVPAGTPMPDFVHDILYRTTLNPISRLVEDGVIPSAEVYAGFVPQLVSGIVASSYGDPALQRLMAAHYRAFASRRSLLLLDLQHQVRITELPWVVALSPHTVRDAGTASAAQRALMDVGKAVLDAWPGTILPNKLVSQLATLTQVLGEDVPLVEELAADIFMGEFTAKFARAAGLAASVVKDTVYARYYGIDASELAQLDKDAFGRLCSARAQAAGGTGRGGWVAANGTVIEQAQILTTHNLALLVHMGVAPGSAWGELAARAWKTTFKLLLQATRMPWPLAKIKNAAYAWRQALFFVSMGSDTDVSTFLQRVKDDVHEVTLKPGMDGKLPQLDGLLGGLEDVLSGSGFDSQGMSAHGRQFLGWTLGPHWILAKGDTGA